MAVIIQKFGGTSVASDASREQVLQKISGELKAGNSPVVVVSAMGRRGAPYATDTFLDLVPGAAPDLAALIVSCGEIISACIVAHSLNQKGIRAQALSAYTAGIMVNGPYDGAQPVDIKLERLEALIKEGIVPVIAGFQGVLPDSSIATLGRGGSDTTAVALGAWLGAEYVDIFTDVSGVAMADPRIVPEAPFIPYLGYSSMVRLSSLGSRVLHDLSAKIALEKNVRVRIRSTFDDTPGTIIGSDENDRGPDLAGITVKEKDTGVSLVTLVFKTGRGAAAAEKMAGQHKIAPHTSGDSDAFVFELPSAQVKETLREILKPYIS